ncbi:M35 family metallopeptidase [Paraburkholderia bryophila]|uniref:M35 family metallopeptidase n=1 Tax=Paraburkholderia bryophila TaxID=420952 RepID=UPI00234B72F3|nr:M35 family metallopeptidase [Paraburkholderia bryophila]WCM21573.1 M35 family metallopeptidase [Paraburkholderia bryophila]
MDVNLSVSTYRASDPLPLMQPLDMAAMLTPARIYPPDKAPGAPSADMDGAQSIEPASRAMDLLNGLVSWIRDGMHAAGHAELDTWSAAGQHTRDSLGTDGTRTHDTWDADGKHNRDSLGTDGARTHDTWDADGKHTRESSTASGNHVHESWDLNGNHVRDKWDEDGNHLHEAWNASGKHLRIAWHETTDAPASETGDDGSAPDSAGPAGSTMPSPMTGDGVGGQPLAPIGDADPVVSSAPAGVGDIRAPDFNTGHTDYDQPAPGPARRPVLIGFSPEQARILTDAYQHVKRMIDHALAKLKSGHPDAEFSRWFGTPNAQNLQKVAQVLTRMQHALAHDQYTFVLGAPNGDWELADVNAGSPHQINLKPHFFDHAFGANTPEATIAHELSHFPYIGGTKDHMYGPAAVSNLAARNSTIATDNAENYGMFIRAQTAA